MGAAAERVSLGRGRATVRHFIRRLGMFGDLLCSGILAGLTAMVNVLGVLAFARALEPTAFGLLALSRRVGAFTASVSNLNGHLAVSRYLGFHRAEPEMRSATFAVGTGLLLLVPVLTEAIFRLLRLVAGGVSWVQELDGGMWLATTWFAVALSCGLVVFSILRGMGHPQAANLQQLSFVGLLLLLAGVVRGREVAVLVAWAAAGSMAINMAYYAWVAARHRHEWVQPSRPALRRALRQAIGYSLPRLADGPCQASLPLIGLLLAPSLGGLTLVGYVHIGQTLVRMTEVLVVPLSVIFLPLAAHQVRQGQTALLQRQAQQIYDAVILLGSFVSVQLLVWAPALLEAAFGSRYAGAEVFLRWTLPAILPYLLYAGFRSFIDGTSVRPVNFLHLLSASLVVLAATVGFGARGGGAGIAAAYTLGVVVLGLLTVIYAIRQFAVRAFPAHLWSAIGVVTVGGAFSLAVAVLATGPVVARMLLCAACQIVCALVTVRFLQRVQHPTVAYAAMKLRGACAREPEPTPAYPAQHTPHPHLLMDVVPMGKGEP